MGWRGLGRASEIRWEMGDGFFLYSVEEKNALSGWVFAGMAMAYWLYKGKNGHDVRRFEH